MSMVASSVDIAARDGGSTSRGLRNRNFLRKIGAAILKRVRTAAWNVLDMRTEFDSVD